MYRLSSLSSSLKPSPDTYFIKMPHPLAPVRRDSIISLGCYILEVNNTYRNLSHSPECTKTSLISGKRANKLLGLGSELEGPAAEKWGCPFQQAEIAIQRLNEQKQKYGIDK